MGDSDVVIRVEGLGKKYTIKHEQQVRHNTLRDAVAHQAAALGRWANPFTLAGQLSRARRHAPSNGEEDFWALKDVSFEIRRGERVGIIGRNGAGKSTLLKILSRITEPTTGRVEITGRVASLLEVGTGFHPELTGRENIYLNGAILGMTRREIRSKFDEIVDFAEVEKFLDTPVKRYSSGMYVRLAFAVAAHLEPEILIVDEVLAVGDASFQKKCLGKMQDVAENDGRTIIVVSHQMGTISTLCAHCLVLSHGSLKFEGATDTAIKQYLELAGNGTNGKFKGQEETGKNSLKELYVEEAFSFNKDREQVSSYGSEEDIFIEVDCKVNKWVANTVFGFYIVDQRGRKVFTNNNDTWETIEKSDRPNTIKSQVCIPTGFLVPGQYTLTFAISIQHQKVIDIAENCITISIADTGSIFAAYEGYDYGVVFAPCKWLTTTT